MEIPLLYIKDKQVFSKGNGPMRLVGKPLGVAKDLHEKGYKLLHFVDLDALSGLATNLDVYDGLTFFINVEVECAPRDEFVKKLLSLKCRVVLQPSPLDVSKIREKKLLVLKVPKGYAGGAEGYHDVILEEANEVAVKKFSDFGKRIIIYEKDRKKVAMKTWGVIISS